MKIDANVFIFDMDGTLINSVGVWNEVDRELIRVLSGHVETDVSIQHRRDEILAKMKKEENPYLAYCKYLGELCGYEGSAEEVFEKRYQISQDFLKHKVQFKKGAVDLIKTLHDKKKTLVIATTTRRKAMDVYCYKNENLMSEIRLTDYFSHIFTREDVSAIKPDPEVHFKVMETLQVKPSDCIVFEDSLVGVEAAKSAGLRCMAVYDEFSEREQGKIKELADGWYDDLLQVVDDVK